MTSRAEADLETGARLLRLVKAGVAGAVLLTGLLGALAWRMSLQTAQDADQVAHAHEVSATLEVTLRHLIDVETGARGFALTGLEPFLKPYTSGKDAVSLNLQALRGMVVAPDQLSRLDMLAKQANLRLEEAANLVAMRRQSDETPAMTRSIQGKQAMDEQGKHAMDTVRSTVREMEDREKQLLEQRTQRVRRTRRFTRSAIGLSSILGIIFLSIAGIMVSRQISVAAHAQGQVKALNADLERRVEQRTAALEAEAAARLESEGRLAAVIKWATDSIVMVDDQQHIALFNQAAEKMFQCPQNTALGQPITAFIPHLGRFGENDAAHRVMGLHDGLWAVRANGEKFQIEASISENELAGHQMFTVILRDVTERKQAEETRERLAAIVDSSDDAIISKTLDGTISAWNRGAETIFGYPASEALGKTILMLLPAERAGEEADILARILVGESVKHFETVRVRKDGTNIDVSLTISPIRDGDGLIVGASKIARDISQRKRAEAALRRTDTRRKSALEMAKLGDWELDLTTMQSTRSLLHDQIFGHPSLLPDWNFDIFLAHVHADDREAVKQSFQSALSQGKRWEFEYRIVWEDGTVRWIWGCGNQYLDSAGDAARMFGIVQDVTERREALDALRESEERFQALANGIPQLAWIAAADGSRYWYNQRWYEFTGTTPEEMQGWGWQRVHDPDFLPKVRARWSSAIAEGEPFEMEFPLRGADGLFGAFLTRVMPLKDSGGRVVRWFGTNTDISGLKRTEERLAMQAEEIRELNEDLEERIAKRAAQLAAANQELEAFSYSISHDLRAPLRHIAGFSRILIKEFGPGMAVEARGHLERIQTAVVRMGLLVGGLLDLAKLGRQSLNLCRTELNDVVDQVISMLEPECEGRQVEWHIARLPALDCDPILMAQVFQNLLDNALKYTRGRAGTVIEVDSIRQPGKPAIIFVRDNGVGFNMKYAERLFGVFQRMHTDSKFEGTGVGLATVQRIIQKHGGMIWAEAEVDHGATFYFALQRTEPIGAPAQATAVSRPAP
jgi:PAS domain S-box-containing protein